MPNRRDFLKHSALAAAIYSTRGWAIPVAASSQALPGEYHRRMAKWCDVVWKRMQQEPNASLKELEEPKGWYHFPYTILPAAVLFAKQHPLNPGYRKQQNLDLALQIGDLVVREDQNGTFAPRLDSYRDVSLWIEAYALLESDLGKERATRWRSVIERNVQLLVPELQAWENVPSYTENFLGSSPNHYAWWAATTLAAGHRFQRKEWVELAGRILHRFASTEQNPDGYWGEHNPDGPTGGYNYLTTLAVGTYWEYTKHPDALVALRRATRFHTHTTYPDGNLIELFNDRNRYWHISYWGQFAFTHFPEGRSYAALLMRQMSDEKIDLDALGLIAQNALYYHDGPMLPSPPESTNYVYRLHAEAGVRKQGPWVTALSGIVDTPLPRSQWFLDRQADLAVFHEKTGPIIFGAHSKHQPELATFAERIQGEWISTPKGSRLTQAPAKDSLAVAHNAFSAVIEIPPASHSELRIDTLISGRGPIPEEGWFALQLNLKADTELRTGTGKSFQLSAEHLSLTAAELGGTIVHNGWELHFDVPAELQWPVYPYNPYINNKETKLEHAVGLLRIPLGLKADAKQWLQVDEHRIGMRIRIPS